MVMHKAGHKSGQATKEEMKMKYYRSKGDKTVYVVGYKVEMLVKNELLTETEVRKKFGPQIAEKPDRWFEVVEISKKKTFTNFGVRFERK